MKPSYFTRSAQSYESRFSQRESYSTDVVYFELLGDLSRMTESTHNMAMENNATTWDMGIFFLSFFLFSFLLLQKCHPLMPRYVCCLSKVQGWSLLLYYNSNKNKRIWKEGMVGVEWRRRYSIKNEKVLQFCHSFFCIFLLIFVQHKNATFFLKTLFKAILY